MSGHTKGPWRSYGNGVLTEAVVPADRTHGYGCGNDFVCSLNDGEYHEYFDESEQRANARLIAAAPDLLEALILLEAEMVLSGNAGSTDYGWKPAIEKTRAAISRATEAQP